MSKKAFTALVIAIIAVLAVIFISPAFASAAEAVTEDAGIQAFFIELKDNITEAFNELKNDIYNVLIKNDNYKHITDGLLITIEITLAALVIGLLLGFFVAIIRSTHDKTGKFRFLNSICKLYLTIFRGTPVIVQLLIIYYLWLG